MLLLEKPMQRIRAIVDQRMPCRNRELASEQPGPGLMPTKALRDVARDVGKKGHEKGRTFLGIHRQTMNRFLA